MTTWRSAVPNSNEQRDKKRETLLREAAVIFTRRGFHGTSLSEIAENLGVTKAALYTYVQGKDELLFLCHTAAMDAAFESLEEALARGTNGREKLILTLRMYLEKIIGEQSFCAIILEEGTLTPKDSETIIGRRDLFEREMRKLVIEGIADGSIVRCTPRIAVFAMLGAVNWVLKWFSPDGTWNQKQLAFAMTQFLERALSTQPIEALIEDPADHS